MGGAGGPLAVLVTAVIAAEFGKAVSKETKVDILVTPIVTILVGIGLAMLVAAPIGKGASWVGNIIMWATEQQPFVMGIVVSVIVGIALTLPISSAAICAALSLTGLAGGAAVAGCCANMVGFAVLSFRENGWGGLVSQGLGTSMLQMGNIVRNPKIWIPAIVTSAITGPIATCIFKLQMNGAAVNSGMGTCGLCGPIGVWTGWVAPSEAAIAKRPRARPPAPGGWSGPLRGGVPPGRRRGPLGSPGPPPPAGSPGGPVVRLPNPKPTRGAAPMRFPSPFFNFLNDRAV